MTVHIDPVVCSFLADHTVAGVPLLPTVLQLDVAYTALRRQFGDTAGLRLRDIRVGEPVRCERPRTLVVRGRAVPGQSEWDVALTGIGGAVHLQAAAGPAASQVTTPDATWADALPASDPTELSGTPELIYPPMFHGPAFQVIGRFGRDHGGLTARPARLQTAWNVAGQGGALPVRLLELLLQACGVWELAATGRMMRPAHIGELIVPTTSVDRLDAQVHVRPHGAPDARHFDGVACDREGRVLLRFTDYRPVDLGLAADEGARARIAARIGRIPGTTDPSTTDLSTTDPSTSEGDRR